MATPALAQPATPPPVTPPELLPPSQEPAPGLAPPSVPPEAAPLPPERDSSRPAAPPQPSPRPLPSPSPILIDDISGDTALASPAAEATDEARPTIETGAGRVLATPNLAGSLGLLRTSAAATGAPGSWRLGMRGEYASGESFLIKGDRNRRLAGNFAFATSLGESIELWATLLAISNHNERCVSSDDCRPEPERVDPPFIRSFGDLVLGGKFARTAATDLALGVEGGLKLYSANDSLGFDADATSGFITALGSFDFRQRAAFPVVVNANLGFVVDNSRHLDQFEELGESLINSRAVAGFAYGQALSRWRAALGLGAPLGRRQGGAGFTPFVEYQIERVVGDFDPAFAAYASPRCDTPAGRGCSQQRVQHRLDFGARALLAGGFGFDAAAEIATGSVGHAFGPPLPTWNLIFGFHYAFDPAQNRPIVRTVTVERVVERQVVPPLGYVGGRVLDSRDGTPVAAAIIDVVGGTRARVATDSDGAFVTKGLAPGFVDLEANAPGFGLQAVRAKVELHETTAIEVRLLPMPAAPPIPTAPVAVPTAPVSAAPTTTGGVSLESGRLIWKRPIEFAGTPVAPTAELTAPSRALLDDLVVLLRQHPDAGRVRVDTHWDNGIPREAALALTHSQANAIAQHLIGAGLAPERLVATGHGSTRPKVPNLGPQSRSRNRRVEITLSR